MAGTGMVLPLLFGNYQCPLSLYSRERFLKYPGIHWIHWPCQKWWGFLFDI